MACNFNICPTVPASAPMFLDGRHGVLGVLERFFVGEGWMVSIFDLDWFHGWESRDELRIWVNTPEELIPNLEDHLSEEDLELVKEMVRTHKSFTDFPTFQPQETQDENAIRWAKLMKHLKPELPISFYFLLLVFG